MKTLKAMGSLLFFPISSSLLMVCFVGSAEYKDCRSVEVIDLDVLDVYSEARVRSMLFYRFQILNDGRGEGVG